MSRLPQVGSDNGTWGTVLNDFLSVSLTGTGTVANGVIDTAQLSSALQTSIGLANTALQSVTKTSVGLGNVDNTTDLGKPISTATQTALDAKVSTSGLDAATATLIGGSSSTATAVSTKVTAALAGSTNVYILAPADPDPTTGSPAGLYFRRTT